MSQLEGKVKWFSNSLGFGFIHPVNDGKVDDTVEYFVHFSSIKVEGFKTLTQDQKVKFSLKPTEKGIQAVDVEVI